MRVETLAQLAQEARRSLDLARARLERSARRFAQSGGVRGLRELAAAAEAFEQSQSAEETAVRKWARALASSEAPRFQSEGASRLS